MSRSYKGVRVKAHRVYSIEDLMALYGVTANTISNWNADGLMRSDGIKPYLYQGKVVAHFHAKRMARQRMDLRPGEFKCMTCKAAGFPDIETVDVRVFASGRSIICAICPSCQAPIRKIPSEADCDIIEDCRNPNTSRVCLHEGEARVPGGIGISAAIESPTLHFENDRLLYQWQTYAGRYNDKTIARHLAAVRYCERVTSGKAFGEFTNEDAAKVRDDLKRRAQPDADDHLGSSSIRHIVSHLEAFFVWLMKQNGYKRMPKDLPDYFKLPKAVLAAEVPKSVRAYATLEEAEDMLRGMPRATQIDKRQRAIVAMSYLTAFRADTTISLRIEHVDVKKRVVKQDGKVSRAKAGKSLLVKWFPLPEIFVETIADWLHWLSQRGFEGSDALFPSASHLHNECKLNRPEHASVPVMTTTHAVTDAFAKASLHGRSKFTPHSVKDTLTDECDRRFLTAEQRKAWSQNLGHNDSRTTEKYYAKMSSERRMELLETIETQNVGPIEHLTDAQKIAIIDEVLAIVR